MRYALFTLLIFITFVLFACGIQTDYSSYQAPENNQDVGGGCGVAPQNEYPLDCSVPIECLLPASTGNTGL